MTGPAPKLLPLRIRLPYAAEEEFIERYGSNVGRGGIFVATRALKPEGTGLAFEFVLADGTRLLRGEGVVLKAQPDAGSARTGMTVRFTRLDAASKALIDRIVARRNGPEEAQAVVVSPAAPTTDTAPRPPGLVRRTPAVNPSRPVVRASPETVPTESTAPTPPPVHPSRQVEVTSRNEPWDRAATPKASMTLPAVKIPAAVAAPLLADPDEPVSLFPEQGDEEAEEELAPLPAVSPSRKARKDPSGTGAQRATQEMFTVRPSHPGSFEGTVPERLPAAPGAFSAVKASAAGDGATGHGEALASSAPEADPSATDPFTDTEPEGLTGAPSWAPASSEAVSDADGTPLTVAAEDGLSEAPSWAPASSDETLGSVTAGPVAAPASSDTAPTEAFAPAGNVEAGGVLAPGSDDGQGESASWEQTSPSVEADDGRAQTLSWEPTSPEAHSAWAASVADEQPHEAAPPEAVTSRFAEEGTSASFGFVPASVDSFDPNAVLGDAHAPEQSPWDSASLTDETGYVAAGPALRSFPQGTEASTPAFADSVAGTPSESEPSSALAATTAAEVVSTEAEQSLEFDVDLSLDPEEERSPPEGGSSATPAFDGVPGSAWPEATHAPAPVTDPRQLEAERLRAWGIDPESTPHGVTTAAEDVDPFTAALEQAVEEPGTASGSDEPASGTATEVPESGMEVVPEAPLRMSTLAEAPTEDAWTALVGASAVPEALPDAAPASEDTTPFEAAEVLDEDAFLPAQSGSQEQPAAFSEEAKEAWPVSEDDSALASEHEEGPPAFATPLTSDEPPPPYDDSEARHDSVTAPAEAPQDAPAAVTSQIEAASWGPTDQAGVSPLEEALSASSLPPVFATTLADDADREEESPSPVTQPESATRGIAASASETASSSDASSSDASVSPSVGFDTKPASAVAPAGTRDWTEVALAVTASQAALRSADDPAAAPIALAPSDEASSPERESPVMAAVLAVPSEATHSSPSASAPTERTAAATATRLSKDASATAESTASTAALPTQNVAASLSERVSTPEDTTIAAAALPRQDAASLLSKHASAPTESTAVASALLHQGDSSPLSAKGSLSIESVAAEAVLDSPDKPAPRSASAFFPRVGPASELAHPHPNESAPLGEDASVPTEHTASALALSHPDKAASLGEGASVPTERTDSTRAPSHLSAAAPLSASASVPTERTTAASTQLHPHEAAPLGTSAPVPTERTDSASALPHPDNSAPLSASESADKERTTAASAQPHSHEAAPLGTSAPVPTVRADSASVLPHPDNSTLLRTGTSAGEERTTAASAQPHPFEAAPLSTSASADEERTAAASTQPHPFEAAPLGASAPVPTESTDFAPTVSHPDTALLSTSASAGNERTDASLALPHPHEAAPLSTSAPIPAVRADSALELPHPANASPLRASASAATEHTDSASALPHPDNAAPLSTSESAATERTDSASALPHADAAAPLSTSASAATERADSASALPHADATAPLSTSASAATERVDSASALPHADAAAPLGTSASAVTERTDSASALPHPDNASLSASAPPHPDKASTPSTSPSTSPESSASASALPLPKDAPAGSATTSAPTESTASASPPPQQDNAAALGSSAASLPPRAPSEGASPPASASTSSDASATAREAASSPTEPSQSRAPDAPTARSRRRTLFDLTPAVPATTPAAAEVVLGIDVGTSHARVAAFINGVATPIPLPGTDGAGLPSVIAMDSAGALQVGTAALAEAALAPRRATAGLRRLLGVRARSPHLRWLAPQLPFPVATDLHGDAGVELDGRVVAPTLLAAMLLRELRQAATTFLGRKVTRAVLCAPSHFTERQRASLREAATLAGLDVPRVLTNSAAAALAYAHGRGLARKRVLVVDLGGGGLEVCVVQVTGDDLEVVTTGGDPTLGGMEFDARIAEALVSDLAEQGHPRPEHPLDWGPLRTLAEATKQTLSTQNSVDVTLPTGRGPTLDRERVEALTADLAQRVVSVTREVLESNALSPQGLDAVLLVGGQSRAPLVRRRLEESLGVPVREDDVDSRTAVVRGAALLGHALLLAEVGRPAASVSEVLTAPIGVAEDAGVFRRVLERNTRLPTAKTLVIPVATPGPLALAFFQGTAPTAVENEWLGSLGLTVERPGEVEVHLELSTDGTLLFSATLPGVKRQPVALATEDLDDAARDALIARSPFHTAPEARPGGLLSGLKKLFGRR